MEWQKPSPQQVWQAIDIYVQHAYASAAPSTTVKSRLETLRSADDGNFFNSPLLERDASQDPRRSFALRSGPTISTRT